MAVCVWWTACVAIADEKPDVNEVAAKLADPDTDLASLTVKARNFRYEGDIPRANGQTATAFLFQPTLPFPLKNNGNFIIRPVFPVFVDQPVPDGSGSYKSKSGIGDIALDLTYTAPPARDRFLNIKGIGIVADFPTATAKVLGTDNWTLGPKLLLGKRTDASFYVFSSDHRWDIAGKGNRINKTASQFSMVHLIDGGWALGAIPEMVYDWEAEQWTIPLSLNVSKTFFVNSRPWRVGAEVSYFFERNDDFAPEWIFAITFTPVLKNRLLELF